MTIPEMISVLEAARDGKSIQWASVLDDGELISQWRDLEQEQNNFNFTHYAYRVKPQPREWWLVPQKLSDRVIMTLFDDKVMAFEAAAGRRNPTGEVIHVREVMDEQP